MGTGQMMLTICAIILLSVIILRVNNGFLNTSSYLMDSKFGVLSVSLATSLIEEATGKSFDNITDSDELHSASDYTKLSTPGKESGEVYPNFNDFDDFHNYSRADSTMPSAIYYINCKVEYINPASLAVITTKSWHKMMTVTVTNSFNNDTLRLSSVYSYFYFR